MADTILIADDEKDLLRGLERTITLERECRVLLAENGVKALETAQQEPVDLVLADINMPGMDGLELLKAIKARDANITVIIMTAYGTIERAVAAIKAGAYDFIQKPLDEDRLMHLIDKGLERNRLVRENARLLRKICQLESFGNMVGQSESFQGALKSLQMLARTDVTVLILGETGTGKDLAAQAIHQISPRCGNPLVTVNCPALPENLLESELFGYVKGAFTNADTDKKGLFEQAHGGTIFLDEIGDLPLSVQTKLLRVLQEKEIRPLGAAQSHRVDVRIIAATNRNLQERIEAHQFREDLYYRLNVGVVTMPPLREMQEDIPLLVEHFLHKTADEQNIAAKRVAPELLSRLMSKSWPGNVRELQNSIRRWCAVTPGPVITTSILTKRSRSSAASSLQTDFTRPYMDLKSDAIETFTMDYLCRLLEHTAGNITLSAQLSGIKRQSLQKIIRRYGIPVERFRRTPGDA